MGCGDRPKAPSRKLQRRLDLLTALVFGDKSIRLRLESPGKLSSFRKSQFAGAADRISTASISSQIILHGKERKAAGPAVFSQI